MNSIRRMLPRLAAAFAFATSATAAVVVGGAVHAGSTAATAFNGAPQAADAAVFVGVHVGYGNYPHWRWDGYHRSWIHAGFGFGYPGYISGGYVGYAAPVGPPYWVAPFGYRSYWHPAFYGGYGRPYYRPGGFYGRPYYGGGYYRGGYSRGGYGGGYSRGGYRR